MFSNKTKVLLGTLIVCACSNSLAQQPNPQLEQIVVIANRIPVAIKRIGASVSLIDEQAIKAHGNFSLKDVLRQSAAIGVSSNGGIGATSSLRIRGEEGFRTLTFFDGLKLADPSGPQVSTPVEHILSSGVSRVEVLRGPQGLGYGADAGGVVSISSNTSVPGVQGSIDGQAGSRSTEQLAATFAAANESVDFFIAAADFQSNGYNVRLSDTVLADSDGYENNSYHTRLGFNASENLRLELVHRDVAGNTEYDGCYSGTTVHDCNSVYDLQASRLSANYNSSRFSHSLAFINTKTERNDLALGSSAFRSSGELRRWEYVGSAIDLPGFDLVFGVDLEQEENGNKDRNNEGYYFEYLSDFSSNWFFSAGMRRDENDDFGEHSSYRINAAYLIDLDAGILKIKSSYGSGFRAPSLFEIAYNSGPFGFPPAASVLLSEESSSGFEYGVEYLLDDRLRLELVVFDQDVEDAIIFDLASFSGYLQETGTSNSKGVELIGAFSLTPQLRLSANYTFNEPERPGGLQRLRRPEQLANVGLTFSDDSQRLHLNAFYRISRDAIDEVFGTPLALDDFEVLDFSASYRFNDRVEVFGRIENALDEHYQEVTDFRSPERGSYLGIRLNF